MTNIKQNIEIKDSLLIRIYLFKLLYMYSQAILNRNIFYIHYVINWYPNIAEGKLNTNYT